MEMGEVSRYTTTAQVLRLLVSRESRLLDGDIEPLHSVFRIGAEACEQFDEVHHRCSRALVRIAELEGLLARVADILETAPLPIDGGTWPVFTLTQEIRRALGQAEPQEATQLLVRASGSTRERHPAGPPGPGELNGNDGRK
jgi:hypothetical protein